MATDGETQLTDGLYHFRLADGTPFTLDPIEAFRELNAIGERTKNEGNFRYAEEFAAWIEKKTGVKVSISVADELNRAINLRYNETMKTFTDALKSLSSTESTLSEI